MPKANYDLPNEKIHEIIRLSGVKSKREALIVAIDSYLQRKRLEKLIRSYGKVSLSWTKKSLSRHRE